MTSNNSKTYFVLVAGFSADHLEATKLKASLDKLGFHADAISFYGRGHKDDFTNLKIATCLKNVSDFINKKSEQYENVYGIGVSLGGALLLEHAKNNNNLKGLASIGTPFKLNNSDLIRFGLIFLPLFYFIWRRLQKIKFLRLNPLGATKAVMDYLEIDFLHNLDLVKTPVLLLHSKKDPVSDYKVLPKYLKLLSSEKKTIKYFKNGNHVIDHDPDLVISHILNFLKIKKLRNDNF